jgi:hypothetical protein
VQSRSSLAKQQRAQVVSFTQATNLQIVLGRSFADHQHQATPVSRAFGKQG